MTLVEVLPHVTASLNALAGALALVGFALIKSGNRLAHKAVMTAAVVVSALFLATYLLHHFLHPLFQFRGEGAARTIYFTLLFTHVVLAVVVTPMIVLTYVRGRRALASGETAKHRALARWTFPIWVYVSVSGIVVYWLLYHVYV
jgi:putative membrane protein